MESNTSRYYTIERYERDGTWCNWNAWNCIFCSRSGTCIWSGFFYCDFFICIGWVFWCEYSTIYISSYLYFIYSFYSIHSSSLLHSIIAITPSFHPLQLLPLRNRSSSCRSANHTVLLQAPSSATCLLLLRCNPKPLWSLAQRFLSRHHHGYAADESPHPLLHLGRTGFRSFDTFSVVGADELLQCWPSLPGIIRDTWKMQMMYFASLLHDDLRLCCISIVKANHFRWISWEILPLTTLKPHTSSITILIFFLLVILEWEWQKEYLYERLMLIPESFLNMSKTAIIIPAFEYLPKLHVQSNFEQVLAGYINNVPLNKSSLASCMNAKQKNCTIFREKAHLHVIPLSFSHL